MSCRDYFILSGQENDCFSQSRFVRQPAGARLATMTYACHLAFHAFYNYIILSIAYILMGDRSIGNTQTLIYSLRLLLGVSLLSCSLLIVYASMCKTVKILIASLGLTILQSVATITFSIVHLKMASFSRVLESYETMSTAIKLTSDFAGIFILLHFIWTRSSLRVLPIVRNSNNESRLSNNKDESDQIYYIRATRV